MIKETQSSMDLYSIQMLFYCMLRPFAYEFLFSPALRYTVGNKTRTEFPTTDRKVTIINNTMHIRKIQGGNFCS